MTSLASNNRISVAQQNSGVVVGTKKTSVETTAGTEQSSQTAFIKVYQDAGVIGVAMITLLALCLLLAVFCSRLIKMYSSLTESRNQLDQLSTAAIERLTTATLLLKTEFGTALTEIRREHLETTASLNRIHDAVRDLA